MIKEARIKKVINEFKNKLEDKKFDNNTLNYVIEKLENYILNVDYEKEALNMKAINKFNIRKEIEKYGAIEKIEFEIGPMVELNYGDMPISCYIEIYYKNGESRYYNLDDLFDTEEIGDILAHSLYNEELYFKPLLSMFDENDYDILKDVVIKVYGEYEDYEDNFEDFKKLANANYLINPKINRDT